MSSQSIKPGSKVRVSFEGTIIGRDVDSGNFVVEFENADSKSNGYFSRESIEVLSPPIPDEPKLFGALVRVDGRLWTRTNCDDAPWTRGPRWRHWEQIIRKATDVTVLFEGAE